MDRTAFLWLQSVLVMRITWRASSTVPPSDQPTIALLRPLKGSLRSQGTNSKNFYFIIIRGTQFYTCFNLYVFVSGNLRISIYRVTCSVTLPLNLL